MANYKILLIALLAVTSCNLENKKSNENLFTNKTQISITDKNFEKLEVFCDTVYNSKKYKLTLTKIDTTNNFSDKGNTIFTFERFKKGQYNVLFIDTIYCESQEIDFASYSKDRLKSIIIKNNEDVRSNWTYYLYLVDTSTDKLIRVKGFEEIKNPNYLSKFDLIDNYVLSGRNWTNFYQIDKDSVIDYNSVLFDDGTNSGSYSDNEDVKHPKYPFEYKRTIRKILKRRETTANN